MLLGFLVVQNFWSPKEEQEQVLEIECPGKEQIIYIANAENLDVNYGNDNILFSKALKGKVERQIGSAYFVHGLTEEYNFTNRDKVEGLFTNDSCEVKGIFVNAIYATNKEFCQVYIDVVGLELALPGLKGENRIILDNPPNVQFKINPDAALIANFVLAIAKQYEGSAKAALDLYTQIEQKVNLEEQPELQAFVRLNKGNNYIVLGDLGKAAEEFSLIGGIGKYKPFVEKNTKAAEFLIVNGEFYPFKRMKDGKRWLTKNLNVDVKGSYCFDNDPKKCAQYGRLYTWEAAKEACSQLGDGWHLPTDEEWQRIVDLYSYEELIAGGDSGFDVLLGGNRNTDGSFLLLGASGDYWSATEAGWGPRLLLLLQRRHSETVPGLNYDQGLGFSVRCLQK